jgi:ribosomal protein S5
MSGSKNKLNIAAATIKALSVFASPKKVEAKPVAFVDSE